MLSDEFGLEPGPALRELEAKVVEQSSSWRRRPAFAPTDGAASSAPGPGPPRSPHPHHPRRPRPPTAPALRASGRCSHSGADTASRCSTPGSRSPPWSRSWSRVRDDGSDPPQSPGTPSLSSIRRPGSSPGRSRSARGRARSPSTAATWVTLPDRGAVVQIDAKNTTVKDTVPVGAESVRHRARRRLGLGRQQRQLDGISHQPGAELGRADDRCAEKSGGDRDRRGRRVGGKQRRRLHIADRPGSGKVAGHDRGR